MSSSKGTSKRKHKNKDAVVTLEQLESLINTDKLTAKKYNTDMTKLTATLFGIAGNMAAQSKGDHGTAEPSALKKLLVQFDKFGEVGKHEIEQFLNELGSYPSDVELQDMIDQFDGDDNGRLQLNEFLAFLLHELQINDTEDEIIDAFRVFDKDGNGFINAVEIRRVMTNLGDKLTDDEVDVMIRKSDLDGDGQVNYEEFVKIIMTKMRAFESENYGSKESALLENQLTNNEASLKN